MTNVLNVCIWRIKGKQQSLFREIAASLGAGGFIRVFIDHCKTNVSPQKSKKLSI